ncbi:MAG TPA: rhomboid family intramembrane serine protease, partial [Mycobacterium sp.]|nr:rhomboid family intramembrane serine protease [Mycobacterium sp.]
MSAPYPPGYPPALTCYRHPDRQTYVQCTRCGRPVCPECMRSAAVGHQCVDCVAAAAAAVPPVKTVRSGSSGRIAFADSPVTYSLIAVNVVMFVLQMASRGLERQLVLWPP